MLKVVFGLIWLICGGASIAGQWSASSVGLEHDDGSTKSANRTVSLSGSELRLNIQGKGYTVQVMNMPEIVWSPDYSGLAVTESDGGWVGTWSVYVMNVKHGVLEKVDVSNPAIDDFVNHTSKCKDEVPNTGLVKWLDSDSVLLAVESPNHSSCQDMGVVRGYIVSVSKRIVMKRLGECELQNRYAEFLGDRVRNCVK